jgi:hypothetical protein
VIAVAYRDNFLEVPENSVQLVRLLPIILTIPIQAVSSIEAMIAEAAVVSIKRTAHRVFEK